VTAGTRTRIKFCGLVRPVDVDDAVALGVDAVGFVFYRRSPRYLSPDDAAVLRRRLPSFVSAVGLFVDESPTVVADVAARVGLDVLQLHGDETPGQGSAIAAAAADRPWWKAIRMRAETDLLSSAGSFAAAECLLLDAFSEGYGGSGKTFDWSWIPSEVPFRLILSGGLDEQSVADAIRRVRPFAVDVSSGIQGDTPRSKDRVRMERFVSAVLSADAGRP
jgi:phosphoribosylanthranilate isomerase